MVISLSSDKAVWDAVLNNEVVREIKQSLAQGLCKYFIYLLDCLYISPGCFTECHVLYICIECLRPL